MFKIEIFIISFYNLVTGKMDLILFNEPDTEYVNIRISTGSELGFSLMRRNSNNNNYTKLDVRTKIS